MPAALLLLRLTSQAFHSMMGGMAVFCLFFAITIPNPSLLLDALKWGGAALAILYFQGRYLDR